MNPFGLIIVAIGVLLVYAGGRQAFGGSSSGTTTPPSQATGGVKSPTTTKPGTAGESFWKKLTTGQLPGQLGN